MFVLNQTNDVTEYCDIFHKEGIKYSLIKVTLQKQHAKLEAHMKLNG